MDKKALCLNVTVYLYWKESDFFLQKFWLKMNTGFSKELGGVFKKVINY